MFHLTHNATQPLSDITGGNLQVTCSLFWSDKSLYTNTENVVLLKTFKYTLWELPIIYILYTKSVKTNAAHAVVLLLPEEDFRIKKAESFF